jgi:hypothetical protein
MLDDDRAMILHADDDEYVVFEGINGQEKNLEIIYYHYCTIPLHDLHDLAPKKTLSLSIDVICTIHSLRGVYNVPFYGNRGVSNSLPSKALWRRVREKRRHND